MFNLSFHIVSSSKTKRYAIPINLRARCQRRNYKLDNWSGRKLRSQLETHFQSESKNAGPAPQSTLTLTVLTEAR
jgi:hypothetical protein